MDDARTDASGRRANPHTHTPPHPHTHTPTPLSRLRRGSAGFSLVEILVATTILLIIVMMISMVFQQTSGAYQSGTRRVRSQTVLRNILGAISRDMILAVDSRNYPGDKKNKFDSLSASFIALTGTPDAAGKRAPQWIEFIYSDGLVTRYCTEMECRALNDGTVTWIGSGAKKKSTLNPSQNEKLTAFAFLITADPHADSGTTLPLRVDIEGSIQTDGKGAYVSGRSAGKDRKWDTADDIIVGSP